VTRSQTSLLALLSLLALTAATWHLSEAAVGPWGLAGVAVIKAAIIGTVFLELDRSWPGWAALAALMVITIAGGAALIMSLG